MNILTDAFKVHFSNGWGGLNVFLMSDDKNRLYAEFKNGKRKVVRRVYEKHFEKYSKLYFRFNCSTYVRYE